MKSIIHQLNVITTLTLISAGLCGCGTAKVAGHRETGIAHTARPAVVYVTDFDLEVGKITSEQGLLLPPSKPPGPLGSILPPLPGTPKDPAKLARELVNSMSEALVKDLGKAGLTTRRLGRSDQVPSSGWLVRGVFTEVNQGNQMERSMIGFGMGKTDLQVMVDVADLTLGEPRPFYELNTKADSGRMPGAAPMAALNPAAGAARFVMAGDDLKHNVKQTASKIAQEVAQRCETAKPILTAEAQRR